MKKGNWPKALAIGTPMVIVATIVHSEIAGDAWNQPEQWIIRVIGSLIIIWIIFGILGEKYEGLK